MAPTGAAEIVFDHVTKRYPGREEAAVEDLSLTIPAGDICILVGPSGAGKTTAMKMVNRLIEYDEGDIRIDGTSIRDQDVTQLRRRIGYVIQHVGLFPHMTIADNIATVPRLLGWSRDRQRTRVAELLELVGLEAEYAKRYPAQLSGGQRQRVGLARALAADPPLMLMDEPFGALDPITRDRLQLEFLRLHDEVRKTVIFVTHDIDEAIKLGDRIAIMREGGVLAQYDTPDRLLAHPADDFVARFVGADRGLKRLALRRLDEIELEPVDGSAPPDAPRTPGSTTLRDALSLMMAEGGRSARRRRRGRAADRASVGAPDRARALGAVSGMGLHAFGSVALPARHRFLATLAVGGGPGCPREAGSGCRGGGVVNGLWLLAQSGGGPVIPDFGTGSKCETENHLFCWGWVHDHWGDTLQPALLQHLKLTLIAVAIGFVDRLRLGPRRVPLPEARPADRPLLRLPLHDPEPRALPAARAADGADGDDGRGRARQLHAADPLPQHPGGPPRSAARRP